MSTTTDDITLRPVPGPSAVGGGWRRALELLYMIAVFNFKKSYFGTALGYAWSVARPLVLFAVLVEVFTRVFRFPGNRPGHYAVLLLMNIVLFSYFQEATMMAVGSVTGQESIVRKTQFPRLVIPLAVVLTSLFNLALNLLVVLGFILAFGVTPHYTWLLLPLIVLLLTGITAAVSMLLAALYPRYRDVQIIWAVFATALFYVTPILYTIANLSTHHTLKTLILANPLTPIFELARKWIISPSAPSPATTAGGFAPLLIPIGIYIAICVLAVWVFNREAPRIAEEL